MKSTFYCTIRFCWYTILHYQTVDLISANGARIEDDISYLDVHIYDDDLGAPASLNDEGEEEEEEDKLDEDVLPPFPLGV